MPLALALSLLLAACGSGGSGGSSVAGGGIGGTGKGTVTSVTPATPASLGAQPFAATPGSIVLNNSRTFAVTGSTTFFLDDQPSDATTLQSIGNGLVARVDVGDDVNPEFTSGTAVRVVAEHQLVGPVTSVSPLAVLGQPVLITTDPTTGTVVDVAGGVGSLQVGNIVEVSGHTAPGGGLQATRIEKEPNPPTWRLIGPVTTVVWPNSVTFGGTQTVQITGLTATDCPNNGPVAGDPVKVKMTEAGNPSYVGNLPALTQLVATAVECERPGIELPPELTSGTVPLELEGFVTAVDTANTPPLNFEVNGQPVQIVYSPSSPVTWFDNGGPGDLAVGTRVEVVGKLDAGTAELTATRVEFGEMGRFRIIAPATAKDTNAGTITVLGIAVKVTDLTEMEGFNLASLAVPNTYQVIVTGFMDGATPTATEIELSSTPSADAVHLLRGIVDTKGTSTFTVLGITVDANSATHLEDKYGVHVQDVTTFMSGFNIGDQVNVRDATFDVGTSSLSGARIDFNFDD